MKVVWGRCHHQSSSRPHFSGHNMLSVHGKILAYFKKGMHAILGKMVLKRFFTCPLYGTLMVLQGTKKSSEIAV